MPPKRFSDFAKDEKPLAGEKVKLDSILNREILITGFKLKDSKFSKKNSEICLMIQLELDGQRMVVFTGSTVLQDQIQKYKEEIPFLATIIRIDRYYTFS